MTTIRAYQAVLQPTARQAASLNRLLDAQRELYNAALEERRGAWLWERRRVTRFEQYAALTRWDHPVMEFGVRPARGTLLRLDRAFQDFYRRCQRGQVPGFPRFKSAARWASVEYPDTKCWRIDVRRDGVGRVHVKGVGAVRYRGAKRGIRGVPKTLVVRREGRRWRITVACAVPTAEPVAPTGGVVGIDLGVTHLAATSDGELVDNPRHLRSSLDALAARQQIFAGRRRGSHRRRKAAARVAQLHRKVARQRRDVAHKLSRRLVDDHDLIVHEDLKITNLTRRPAAKPNDNGEFDPNGAAAKAGLNREILASGWGQLLRMIAYKAEEAGRQVIAVDPRHTSQTCHECGHVDKANREGVTFACRKCGHTAHADVNAARNILRAGLALRREREVDHHRRVPLEEIRRNDDEAPAVLWPSTDDGV